MNSPTRHEKHDAEDGQLSPVLGRKRYPRRPTRKSQKESKEEQVKTKSPEKSPLPKPLNSFIPVPIKDAKDAKDVKKHPNVSKSHEVHDTQETSSTRLTNFKQEVLTNCAKIAFAEVGASNKVTSIRFHKYSVSEGTLKYKTLETPNISGSDSKVVDHFQQKCPRTKGHTKDGRYHKEDIKSASGDISEDHNETVMRIPKAHLDMLYENKLFFGGSGSKTTLDSCSPSIAPSLSPSSKESDVSEEKTKSVCNKVEAFDQEQCSQPNYSETRDATVGNTAQTTVTTHAQQRSSPDKERGYKNKMKSAFLTKDLLKFEPAQITTQQKPEDKEKHAVSAKLTPNLAQEVLGWNEGDLDNLHQDGDTAAPFQGFTIEEIELTEKKFEQSKNFQQQRQRKTVVTTKKKLRRSIASELNKMEEKMADVNKTPPKLEPSKNVEHNGEITKPDESIAVGTNNRVQICIGNNRIQINIKSDKKQECVVSNKSEDTPIAAKAIEMPLQCKAGLEKSKSHGFWSYSTDESKKCVPTKRVYNNADDYSICNEHKRKGCEISTSGFKSESEQQDIPKVEGVPQKDIEKFPGMPINLDKNFPSTSGSKSSKMGRLESEMDTETTLTSSPMELMEASSEDTLQAKEVPEMPKHLEGRKILKARSLLGRRTPEGTITGNNIRKSLFSKDFDDAEKPKSADIVEFGKVDSFKFDFQTAFKSASGKNISLSPEKLKAASRLLDYDGTSSEEDLILCNANVAKLKTVTNNLTEDDIKVVPHKKLDRSAVLARRLSFDQDQVEDNNPGPSKVEILGGFIRASASGRKFSVDADKPPNSSSFFDDIHLPDIKLKRDKFAGFTSASGKKLSVDPDKYKKAASLFPEDAPNETEVSYRKIGDDTKGPGKNSPILQNNIQKETASNFTGFSSASGKKLTLDPEKLCMANLKFGNDQPSGCDNISFSSASGKKLNTSTEKIKLASSIFQDTEVSKIEPERSTNESLQTSSIKHQHDKTINIQEVDKFVGFTSASGKRLSLDSARIQRASSLFEDTETKTSLSPKSGFSRTSSKKIIVDLEKIKRASSLFKDDGNSENPKDSKYPGFSNASGSRLHIDNEKLNQAMAKFRDTSESGKTSPEREKPSEYSKTAHELIVDVVQSYDKAWQRLNTPKNSVGINNLGKENTEVKTPLKLPLVVPTSNKKQLGMPRMSNFSSISKEKLDRARLLFDDCDKDLNITPMKSFTKSTTLKEFTTPRNSFRYSPQNQQRQGERESFSLLTSTPAKELDNFALDVTPIRTRKFSYQYQKIDKDVNESDGLLLFREKSNSNLKELQNDIELEYLHLKKKLEILEERKKCLEVQRHVIDFDDPEYMRPRLGMLSIHKRGPSRVKLSALTSLTQENFDANDIDTRILEITPQNADKLHFNAARNDRAVVYTLDGAKVVPNTRNMIGVSEINNAFQAMHGIAPKLIPKGWVANHYRWIVWKLACYERKFPEAFAGCLSVESILQQLKYRYDREIDRAERSAIARIVERDDIPSKRIVLCVAEVIQMASHKYELLLTDGWYSIRTIIDNLLIREVQRGKITLGTKLIIQGAELSDGEACHPLEATDSLKLKINYNNTRRALWHLRLGYYHIPTPFPILLRSIHPDGGQITCIKVYIMRVYPVRYMEDYKGVKSKFYIVTIATSLKMVQFVCKAWRNAKSEEKRATEFDAERTMEFERVKSEVYDEYEASLKGATVKKLTSSDLNMLRDPKDLYQYIEASNDPESVYEMLTPSQKSLLMEYKQNNIMERQREISDRVMRRMEEKSLANRIVTPMIKILVSDASEDSAKCVVLNVWRPSEEQKMLLQEEHCFSVYNVVVKRNNELNTARRTLFQQHEALTTKRCQRQVLPISMTTDVFYKPLFNEFDTIGVVVEVTIREYDQEVWLADFIGRLLYVKIVDGPKRCSLLDPIKVGSTIACCNLIMHSPHTEFGQCVANQHSTISLFPHFKHLQQALELFKSHLTDVNKLVKDSLAKVDSLRSCVNLRPNRHSHDASFLDKVNSNIFDDSEENATIPSCLTMADVQMSLIDTDKFL